jgi:hypothetical protein
MELYFFMRHDGKSDAARWQVTSLLKGSCSLLPAIVFVTAFVPSAVRAECGDYVIRGEVGLSQPTLSMATNLAQSAQPERQLPMKHSAPHKPCRGPHCSQGTPSLPLPLTTVPPTAEQWGCVTALASFRDFLSTCRLVEESSPLPHLFTQGIYHPPRSGSSLYPSC